LDRHEQPFRRRLRYFRHGWTFQSSIHPKRRTFLILDPPPSPRTFPVPGLHPFQSPSHRLLTDFTQLPQLQPEIIVIGAGIAGTSLSYSLSHAGRRVLLIERDLSQPDRIVGELLQPGGVAALSELGLGGVLEGIDAVGVEGYCVVMGERRVGVPYPVLESMAGEGAGAGVGAVDKVDAGTNGFDNGLSNGHAKGNEYNIKEKDTAAWHVESISGKKEGRSFHHGRLITSLRQRCLHDAPNLTVLEGTVRDLIYCDHTDRVIGISTAFKVPPTTPDGEPTTVVRKIYAPITIIADGCNSKFRKTKGSRLPVPQTRSHFVGVVLKDVTLPMERHGTVCLTPAGPVLLYQIADKGRETRMLVDVKGKLPSVSDGSLRVGLPLRFHLSLC
jgi:squalene monooxygenase